MEDLNKILELVPDEHKAKAEEITSAVEKILDSSNEEVNKLNAVYKKTVKDKESIISQRDKLKKDLRALKEASGMDFPEETNEKLPEGTENKEQSKIKDKEDFERQIRSLSESYKKELEEMKRALDEAVAKESEARMELALEAQTAEAFEKTNFRKGIKKYFLRELKEKITLDGDKLVMKDSNGDIIRKQGGVPLSVSDHIHALSQDKEHADLFAPATQINGAPVVRGGEPSVQEGITQPRFTV